MNRLSEQVFIDILKSELGLTDAQLWVRNQNRKIPPEKGIWVIVGLQGIPRIRSTKSEIETREIPQPDPAPPIVETWEVISATTAEAIQIDIVSRNNDTLNLRMGIIMALASIKSQQVQEQNAMRIFTQSLGFVDTSGAEGGSNVNRYTVTVPCFSWYKMEKLLSATGGDYYDDFTTRVDDAKTIAEPDGLFDFRITAGGIE